MKIKSDVTAHEISVANIVSETDGQEQLALSQ